MDTQELIVILLAFAAGGYLLRGWLASAKRGRCGGCGCRCGCGGKKRPADKE